MEPTGNKPIKGHPMKEQQKRSMGEARAKHPWPQKEQFKPSRHDAVVQAMKPRQEPAMIADDQRR